MRFDVRHKVRHGSFKLTTNSVATYRVAKLLANGKSRLRNRIVAFAKQHYKVFVGDAFGVFVHIVVLIILFKSVFRLQG